MQVMTDGQGGGQQSARPSLDGPTITQPLWTFAHSTCD